jgi:hypothetical protein
MRSLLFALLVLGCSSKDDPPATVADTGQEAAVDAADAAPTDKCATVKCAAPKICDKVDGVCKNVRFTKLGEACTAATCTGVAGATCLEGEFPDGYCSIMPCSVDNPCPIGAVCAKVGGKQACFAACMIDGDCRGGVEYKCQDLNNLVVSGGLRRACYLPSIPCAADTDCPKPLVCPDGKTCTPL